MYWTFDNFSYKGQSQFEPNADLTAGTKDVCIGSILYYSTNQICKRCHTLIPENWPGEQQITYC
jgi:hypothetical protein